MHTTYSSTHIHYAIFNSLFAFKTGFQDFLKSEAAQKAVKSFCNDIEAPVAVLLGLTINDDVVKRDLAVYSEDFPKLSAHTKHQVKCNYF